MNSIQRLISPLRAALRTLAARWVMAALLLGGGLIVWGTASGAISWVGAATATANGTSVTVSRPAGVVAGDLMLANVATRNGVTISGVPSGWTLVTTVADGSNMSVDVYRKFFAAADPASYTFTFSASTKATASVLAFRGVDATSPVLASSTNVTASASSVTALAVTVPVTNSMLVAMFSQSRGDNDMDPPNGMREVVDFSTGSGGSGVSSEAAYAIQVNAGSSGNKVAPASGSARGIGVLVALRLGSSTYRIAGKVFEDINYGGGAGRSAAASGGAAVAGARVELYGAGGSFISSTTSAGDGSYSFSGLAPGNYFVRVASATVLSTRTGAGAELIGVLSFVTDANSGSPVALTDRVGGTDPAAVDPDIGASGTSFNTSSYVFTAGLSGTAHAVSPVTLGSSDVAGVDFGFNFDTVVNTRASGQGSLAQVVSNANILSGDAALAVASRQAGIEHVIFMIGNGSNAPGLRSSINYFSAGVASIAPVAGMTLSAPLVIDGQTQPGWAAAPVIAIAGSAAPAATNGFTLSASNSLLRGLSITQFGSKGVVVTGGATQQVSILANAIYGNSALGIDLGNDGVTVNSGSFNAAFPNRAMNQAVIESAGVNVAGTAVTLAGHVGTGSGQAVFVASRVEVFKAAPDASGYGQGSVYLGALVADSGGRFSGTLSFAAGVLAVGDALTATATDTAGSTSEFGPNTTSVTLAALAPASFNAFDNDAPAASTSGVIRTRVAGAATSLDVVALAASGGGLSAGFTGNVSLDWLDARNDSGAAAGSCRSTWLSLGAAGVAVFSNNARVAAALTPPAGSTRVMRLRMSYSGPGGNVVSCSNDAFAAVPATITLAASDADAATAGNARSLTNSAASGGVVHRAGRPFTLSAQARDATGALMTAYDGTPGVAVTACVLPAGCSAAALTAPATSASGGVYSNASVSYAEVGAVQLQLSDASYADVDAADTPAATRRIASAAVTVGRFIPDSLSATVSSNGQFATGNGACMAPGQGATFLGQGFGWAAAPQVTVTARNAAGAVTSFWTGTLMKLVASGAAPALSVSASGAASLSSSFGTLNVSDLGAGQARVNASAIDRFVLDLAAGTAQASVTPLWSWALSLSDASEAAVTGNPTLAANAAQASVGFDLGAVFHSGRLALAPAHGDARVGVRMLVQLQRYSSAGWVTMTEDRGCVSVAPRHLGVEQPQGVFVSNGVCAAPATAAVTTSGGRAWVVLPNTPNAAAGRLAMRLAGAAASGSSCASVGVTQAVVSLPLPYLLGGSASAGPLALASWGSPNRDAVLRRETW